MSEIQADNARVVQVIETTLTRRGDGRDTVLRVVKQYWSFEGELLAENDPCAGDDSAVRGTFYPPRASAGGR